jgi:prephenate dehydratase
MSPSTPPDPEGGPARVGYLGPEGTFTEEALLASALEGSVEPVPLASIQDSFAGLREGAVEWAIAPIENSLDGSVNVTLDALADDEAGAEIVGEALLSVRHSLIAAEPVELAEITTVLTHPQVPGQCTRFLREQLPHARVLPAASTAEAVRLVVAGGERGQAAIATELAAAIYGGALVREGIQDREDNETRFVWLGRSGERRREPPLREELLLGAKSSLVFWGSGAQRPGWLVRCLAELSDRGINLTRIESRPRRERLGSYMFFADLLGAAGREPVSDAIVAMRGVCEEVRVLGSYRAAAPPEPRPQADPPGRGGSDTATLRP